MTNQPKPTPKMNVQSGKKNPNQLKAPLGTIIITLISGGILLLLGIILTPVLTPVVQNIFHLNSSPTPASVFTPTATSTAAPTLSPTPVLTATAVAIAVSQALHKLSGFSGSPTGIVFLPDNDNLLSVSDDGTAYRWDVENGRPVTLSPATKPADPITYVNPVSHTKGVYKIALSSGGDTFAIGGPDSIVSYNITTGSVIFAKPMDTPVTDLIYGQNAPYLFAAVRNATVLALDPLTGDQKTVYDYAAGSVYGLAITRQGTNVLSGADDSTVSEWKVTSTSKTPTHLKTLTGLSGTVNSVSFSPDERSVLGGSYAKTVQLWDWASGNPIQAFSGHTGSINVVGFFPLPNGEARQTIFTASDDGTVRVWDVATGRLICHYDVGAKVTDAAVSPDGKYIVTASVPANSTATANPTMSATQTSGTGSLLVFGSCVPVP